MCVGAGEAAKVAGVQVRDSAFGGMDLCGSGPFYIDSSHHWPQAQAGFQGNT